MRDPGRLYAIVEHPDGRQTRWGPGKKTDRLLQDLTLTNGVPGGFDTADGTLIRGLEPQDDEGIYDKITFYLPGGRVAWQGRLEQLARGSGDRREMTPRAVGYSRHLEDREDYRQIFVDRNLDWQGPPLAQRQLLAAVGTSFGSIPQYEADNGGLSVALPNTQINNPAEMSAWFDAGPGLVIRKVQYRHVAAISVAMFNARLLRNSSIDSYEASENTHTVVAGDVLTTWSPATPRRYLWTHVSTFASGTPNGGAHFTFNRVAVFGTTLPTYITDATGTTEPHGVRASDVIKHVLASHCPLIAYDDESIPATSIAIPHLSFTDPTTPAEVIARADATQLYPWGVWEGPKMRYKPWGSGVDWEARTDDGAQLQFEGDTGEQLITSVVVSYHRGDNVRRLAGPTGSGLDVTHASLSTTDPAHPAVRWGMTRTAVLHLSFPTTDDVAVALGALLLVERNTATRKGKMTVTGFIRHPREGLVPVSRIRGGDRVIFTDQWSAPRRVMHASYQHGTRTATLTLDSTPTRLRRFLEVLQAYVTS